MLSDVEEADNLMLTRLTAVATLTGNTGVRERRECISEA